MIRKKILLLGDFSVGKTSLIKRYVDDAFSDEYLSTIGVKISKKRVKIDAMECELLIWDIEGETLIKKIPTSYFKGASGAIFVCDISRSQTIETIHKHINTFAMHNEDTSYVIAYNKADLLTPAQKEVMLLPEDIFLTSAKENNNVNALFASLTRKMLA